MRKLVTDLLDRLMVRWITLRHGIRLHHASCPYLMEWGGATFSVANTMKPGVPFAFRYSLRWQQIRYQASKAIANRVNLIMPREASE